MVTVCKIYGLIYTDSGLFIRPSLAEYFARAIMIQTDRARLPAFFRLIRVVA
ncbi:hypothetical protein DSUL_50061 [Desulfovibrionales bacterium]